MDWFGPLSITEVEIVVYSIDKREFGFVFENDGKRSMSRRFSFSTDDELLDFIEMRKPLDCYVSVAYYKYPTQMKDWLGADLFFDFDCEENVKRAYAEALTTYEVLLDDFALNDVVMNFSGSRGYHVIAFDEEPHTLEQYARRQIAEYLIGRYHVETLDVPASCDIKRLRRLEGTINSKSGKLCERIQSKAKQSKERR
jgi:predicted DNA primase small subunit